MLTDIRADAYRASGKSSLGTILWLALSSRTFRPVLTLRFCQWAANRSRVFGVPARLLHRWTQGMAGMDLPAALHAGPGLLLVHGWGTVVNKDCQVGSNVTLFNGVVLGRKDTISAIGRE